MERDLGGEGEGGQAGQGARDKAAGRMGGEEGG